MKSNKPKGIKILRFIVALCILFILPVGLSSMSALAASNDTIHIGVDLNSPPFEYVDRNGEIKGFSVDLARELLQHIEKTPVFHVGNRNQIFEWLEKGQVDMLCNVAHISAPTKNWEYGAINCASPLVLIVPQESSVNNDTPIDSLCVLVEKHGYTSYALGDVDAHPTIIGCKNSAEMLLQLLSGKGDAAYMSYHLFHAVSSILRNTDAFRVIDLGHPMMYFHFAIHQDQVRLKQEVELAMLDMIEYGTYATLHHRYFPDTMEAQVARMRFWLVIILVIVFLLFISFFGYQYFVLSKMKIDAVNIESYMFSVFNHLPFSVSLEKIDEEAHQKIDETAQSTGLNVLDVDSQLDVENIHTDDYDLVVNARKEALQGEDVCLDFVRLRPKENDEELCVDYFVSSIRHNDQDYLLTVGHDMLSIYQLHKQAVQQVEERNHFLSNLSHELHTTLNAVLGFSELVGNRTSEADLEEYKSIIKSKAKQFRLLVDDLILLSNIELAGGSRTKRQNLAVIMKEFVGNEIALGSKTAEQILFEELYSELHVCVDVNVFLLPLRVMMQSVLCEKQSGDVTSGILASEHQLLMYVESNKVNSHHTNQNAIFNCFYSLDASENNTGFGFALVKALVLRLDGKVGIVSLEEGRQLFWMELPMDVDYSLIPEQSEKLNSRVQVLDQRHRGYWYEKDVDGIILVHEPQKND